MGKRKWAATKADDARTLMTINTDIPNLVASLGINAPHTLIEQIEKDIQEELNSAVPICRCQTHFEWFN